MGPFLAVLAVARLAIDNEVALLGCERGEGDVEGDFLFFGDGREVVLGRAVDFSFPAFDGTVGNRERLVGNGESVVDLDDASEATAMRARTERGVE